MFVVFLLTIYLPCLLPILGHGDLPSLSSNNSVQRFVTLSSGEGCFFLFFSSSVVCDAERMLKEGIGTHRKLTTRGNIDAF